MRASIFFSLVLLATGAACAAPPEIEKRPDEQSISMIELIANPDKFEGKNVDVGGYLVLSDDYENSLFLDENAHRSGMSANAIAIDLEGSSPAIQKRAKELDQRYVFIAGRFKSGPTAFSGGQLQGVYRFIPVPKSPGNPPAK